MTEAKGDVKTQATFLSGMMVVTWVWKLMVKLKEVRKLLAAATDYHRSSDSD
jgi:hypothetical protein